MKEIGNAESLKEKTVLGMGFFDSVHTGHRVLIDTVKETARKLNAKSAVLTFSNNSYKQFDSESKLIYTYRERCLLFDELGLDCVIPFEFDCKLKQKSREEFLSDLFGRINIAGIVCGYDYKFGKGGLGDAEYLKAVCTEKDIPVTVVQPVLQNGERVSSTLVKETLRQGNIKKANALLSVPYFMTGKVIHGRGVGRFYGFPTANLEFSSDKMLIKSGVYATKTIYDGKIRKSVTNIGDKPTFEEQSVSVETLIKDENADLYGKEIKIEFVDFLRDIKKFSSPQELADRILKDLEY